MKQFYVLLICRSEEQDDKYSNYHKSTQQIESAAVSKQEIFIEEDLSNLTTVPEEEDLLCLSPSRLALAFGILLVILLLGNNQA